jgi:hypothetical protein
MLPVFPHSKATCDRLKVREYRVQRRIRGHKRGEVTGGWKNKFLLKKKKHLKKRPTNIRQSRNFFYLLNSWCFWWCLLICFCRFYNTAGCMKLAVPLFVFFIMLY